MQGDAGRIGLQVIMFSIQGEAVQQPVGVNVRSARSSGRWLLYPPGFFWHRMTFANLPSFPGRLHVAYHAAQIQHLGPHAVIVGHGKGHGPWRRPWWCHRTSVFTVPGPGGGLRLAKAAKKQAAECRLPDFMLPPIF